MIRHGALGDLINTLGVFTYVRKTFPKANITLLTGSPFVSFMEKTGLFDAIWTDDRTRNIFKILSARQKMAKAQFDFVYDMQNSNRTNLYYQLLQPNQPQWCGIAKGCSHRQSRPDREEIHTFTRFADQLRMAGHDIKDEEEIYPDASWLTADISRFDLPNKGFVLLIPGSSKSGLVKRWPAEHYGDLAKRIVAMDKVPVILGTKDDQDAANVIIRICPESVNLCSKTSLFEIGELARHAYAVVGNDTGPLHLASAMKCPLITLWSSFSSPHLYKPCGEHTRLVYEKNLNDLSVERVYKVLVELVNKYN